MSTKKQRAHKAFCAWRAKNEQAREIALRIVQATTEADAIEAWKVARQARAEAAAAYKAYGIELACEVKRSKA